jgi:dihydrolipoamide dehydrogenase
MVKEYERSAAAGDPVVILGAGPAGYAAAMRCHDLGLPVVLVESSDVGGAGLARGALSSKTWWHLANDYARACRTDRGFRITVEHPSFAAVAAEVEAAVAERRALLDHQLAALGASDPSFRVLRGRGRLIGVRRVSVADGGGGEQILEARAVILATGSTPRHPDAYAIDGDRIATSDAIESWPDFPDRLLVIGAGVVGCEFATIFARFGRTRVELVDRQPRILPFEDEDVSAHAKRAFEDLGVVVHAGARVESLRVEGAEVVCALRVGDDLRTIRADRCLVAAGRVPRTHMLGLTEVGISPEPSGALAVEGTRVRGTDWLYAVGDLTADIALVNVAELEGRHAAESIAGLAPAPIPFGSISAIYFLHPEIASVGLGERAAVEQRIPVRVAVLANRLVQRNVAMRSTGGFLKLLASHEGRLLGLRAVGPQASSAAQGVALLIDRGGTVADLARCIHPHPAVPEGLQECARLLLGESILKPHVFGEELLAVRSHGPWPPCEAVPA